MYDDQKSVEAARQIDLLCDEFERAFIAGETPLIETYLPRVDSRYRVSLLTGLLGVEVDCRIARRELPTIEDYADRFPELSVEEMADARFPELAGAIRRLFDGHQAPAELPIPTPIAGDAQSTSQNGGGTVSSPIRQGPPQIPGYRVGELLGHGGMGLVYRARQLSAHRDVALKVLLHGATATSDEMQRFRNEARAASRLDHPGIVAIYDVGPEGMLPYYSMALVEGPTLKHELEAGPFEPKRAANLLIDIAEAVQYGHDHGVIHRDLKPSNVLLSADGRVRIADFGLAKLLSDGSAAETLTGQVLGTPSYMAPEQARGIKGELSSSVDIYALGALLYTLLTGRPPFLSANVAETLRQVCDEEPVPLRRRNRSIPEDLDTITIKCLEKSPGKRYTTAGAFAEDLRRYLKGVPILARPQRLHHRWWRWSMRNPMTAALVAGVTILSVGGLVELLLHDLLLKRLNSTITSQNTELRQTASQLGEALRESKRIEAKATNSERRAQALLHVAELQLAAKAWQKGDLREVRRILVENVERLPAGTAPDFAWRYLNDQVRGEDGANALHGVLIDQDQQPLYFATFSRDGKWLATCGGKGWLRIYDAQKNYELVRQIDTNQVEVNSVGFSWDNSLLASAGDDGRVCLWSWPEGKLVRSVMVYPENKVFGVTFVDNTSRFVTCGTTNQVILWDVDQEQPLHAWEVDGAKSIEAIAVRGRFRGKRDDGIIMAASNGCLIRTKIYDNVPSGLSYDRIVDDGAKCTAVKYSENKRFRVAGFSQGFLRVNDVSSGTHRDLKRPDGIDAAVLRGDGAVICTDRGGAITVDIPSSKDNSPGIRRTWNGGSARMSGLAIGPDTKHFITAGSNGEVRRWLIDAPGDDPRFTAIGPSLPSENLEGMVFLDDPPRILRMGEISPTGRALFAQSLSGDGEFTTWSAPNEVIQCFDSKGTVIAVGTMSGSVLRLTDMDDQSPRICSVFPSEPLYEVRLFPGNDLVLVRGGAGSLAVVDLKDGSKLASGVQAEKGIALSSDGTLVADYEANTHAVLIRDARSLDVRHRCLGHLRPFERMAFSPDSKRLVSVGQDRSGIVWDTEKGRRIATLSGHSAEILDVVYSPDGRVIATMGADRCIKLWSAETGAEFYEIPRVGGYDWRLKFTPDGTKLIASYKYDSTLCIFGAPTDESSD